VELILAVQGKIKMAAVELPWWDQFLWLL